ncbi:MAG: long-chain-fatty-acid--CoA ligase, partial [Candidatus Bipolaricaulota bacterium]|nr:long-chain-fatty-acid--CoA ligase [Candidatus Bipolaricaulota bacterium]
MRTLSQVLSQSAASFPNRPVIANDGKRITYKELDARVDHVARGLIELGVAKGDKVGLWMPNVAEWIVAYFAVARIGAVVVPMNTRYKPHEVQYILDNSEATTLFMVDTFVEIDYRAMIADVRSQLPRLKNVIVAGEKGDDTHSFSEVEALGAGAIDDDVLTQREAMCDPQDNVFILYTSGTTGNPKGAMLSHHNIAENAKQVTGVLHTTEKDVFLLAVPFFHCFGCVMGIMGSITWGASIVPMTIFKAKEALELVEKEHVSILYGVPTMFVLELEEYRKGKEDGSTYDVSSLRTGIMAGAPCPVEVMKGVLEELHCNVSIAYGLTEASPVITMTRFDDSIDLRVETVGRALPGIEVKISDDDRQPVAANETGELSCRGYNVMLGYYKMPDKTAAAIDKDGWLYSGDLATMDEEGYVKIVGRKKDMLITGGFNVYPAEIEEYLFTHPKVQNVSVVGIPDKVMGEVAVAYIIPREGVSIDLQEIVDYCAGEIANFKVPRYVAIVDEFPMTQSGKIQKFHLQEKTKDLLAAGRLTKL